VILMVARYLYAQYALLERTFSSAASSLSSRVTPHSSTPARVILSMPGAPSFRHRDRLGNAGITQR
jgi:hypothetical protein